MIRNEKKATKRKQNKNKVSISFDFSAKNRLDIFKGFNTSVNRRLPGLDCSESFSSGFFNFTSLSLDEEKINLDHKTEVKIVNKF